MFVIVELADAEKTSVFAVPESDVELVRLAL
jgi:hypothetical protein